MKPAPHFLRPRSAVVFDCTRRMLAGTNLCIRKFATSVAKHYFETVEPDLLGNRPVPFKWGLLTDDIFKAEKHNAQQLGRYMDGTIKAMPADLEDAWVLSLPEPYRSECERELAERRGRMADKRLEASVPGQVVGLGELSREFGDLLQALAPALADGALTDADLPHAKRILNESDDLIAAVMSIRRQVTELLPGEGRPHA